MCNNILDLAGNPSTAYTETDLSPDPYYNFENSLPDWLIRRRKRQQKLAEILKWYQDLHWGWKLGVGIGLLIGAAVLTFFSGGGWLGALGVVAQVAIGVGVAVGLYSLGALFGFYDFSLEGLGNVALEAFLASSAIVFISSGVGFIKHLARSSPKIIDGVEIQYAQQSDFTPEAWERIQSLNHRADGSTISSLRDGRLIHKGFMSGNGKEFAIANAGRADCIVGNTIYELKPNNPWSILRGIAQLHRYNVGMGGGYKLVLVLY